MVKNLPTVWETWVRSLGQEVPWRRAWQTSPVFLPGKSHGQRSLAGYSPWGSKESDTTEELSPSFTSFILFFICFNWRLITLQYCSGFCHPLTWISHGCTCVPNPEPPSHLPPHPIPQGHPSAPALSTLSHAWKPGLAIYFTYDHRHVSMLFSQISHPCLLPQSPKVCSLYLCLFCCLTYRVITTIFLNSISMH